jgi:hypothetical protein
MHNLVVNDQVCIVSRRCRIQFSACLVNSNTIGALLLEPYIGTPLGETTGLAPINKRLDSSKTFFAMAIFLPPNDLVTISVISSLALSKLSAVTLLETSGKIAGIGSFAFKEHADKVKIRTMIADDVLLITLLTCLVSFIIISHLNSMY